MISKPLEIDVTPEIGLKTHNMIIAFRAEIPLRPSTTTNLCVQCIIFILSALIEPSYQYSFLFHPHCVRLWFTVLIRVIFTNSMIHGCRAQHFTLRSDDYQTFSFRFIFDCNEIISRLATLMDVF